MIDLGIDPNLSHSTTQIEAPWASFSITFLRYPRFLISFSLGVVLTLLSPFTRMMEDRNSAIVVIGLMVSSLVFVIFTLRAMLGLTPVEFGV